jgi:hypothetical protein
MKEQPTVTVAHPTVRMSPRPALSAFLCVLVASWATSAAALDRQGAIEVAKRQVGDKCSSATPCTFDAKTENRKWQVRVEFTKRSSPQDKPLPYPGGHAIFIIDQNGKVVGRVEGR